MLVLEDADNSLVDRKTGDLSALSNVLNLGDGLLGQVADIRIIATTNSSRMSLDDAIRRPGRLCTYLDIPLLNYQTARDVYSRLVEKTPEVFPFNNQPISLATVYSLAREDRGTQVPTKATPGQYV